MSASTIVMDVMSETEIITLSCNGDVEDRRLVREAFESMARNPGTLLSVVTEPGEAVQVRRFEEVEQIEAERLTHDPSNLPVEIRAHYAYQGG